MRKMFAVWLGLFFFVGSSLAVAAEKSELKTMNRKYDHVIVKGAKLKGNLDGNLDEMTLYSYKNGQMSPIPFQIDEINENKQWVLPNASPYKEDQKGGASKLTKGDGVISANDELVFMTDDAGDRAPASAYPAGYKAGDELTLKAPKTGELAWVYLFSQEKPPKPSSMDYVDYDLRAGYKKDLIRAKDYIIGFNPKVPITYALVTPNLPGGRQDNYVDRMKIRISATLFGMIKLLRTEEDMESRLWQYKDGPVRVVRMVKSSIRMISRLRSPEVNSYSLYYSNAVHLPFRVGMPFDVSYVAKNVWFSGGVDFVNRYGFKARLNTDPRTFVIDGKMNDLKKSLKLEGAKWFMLVGQESSMVYYIQGLEKYNMACRFIFSDDDKTPSPPEFYPGQTPYIAYNAYNLEQLKKGIVEFNVLVYMLSEKISEESVLKLIDILDVPVDVTDNPIKL